MRGPVYYINGQRRGSMIKTFDEREQWEDAQRCLDELLVKMPEEWELWVSKRASFQWLHQHRSPTIVRCGRTIDEVVSETGKA